MIIRDSVLLVIVVIVVVTLFNIGCFIWIWNDYYRIDYGNRRFCMTFNQSINQSIARKQKVGYMSIISRPDEQSIDVQNSVLENEYRSTYLDVDPLLFSQVLAMVLK